MTDCTKWLCDMICVLVYSWKWYVSFSFVSYIWHQLNDCKSDLVTMCWLHSLGLPSGTIPVENSRSEAGYHVTRADSFEVHQSILSIGLQAAKQLLKHCIFNIDVHYTASGRDNNEVLRLTIDFISSPTVSASNWVFWPNLDLLEKGSESVPFCHLQAISRWRLTWTVSSISTAHFNDKDCN